MARIAFSLIALVLTAVIVSAHAADGRLNAINQTKIIKIAYRTDAKPFSFVNENKEPTGYTIDLCKLVVRSLEKQLGRPFHNIEPLRVTRTTAPMYSSTAAWASRYRQHHNCPHGQWSALRPMCQKSSG
jgi:ABC-type amino acid transport substrate-binding protein